MTSSWQAHEWVETKVFNPTPVLTDIRVAGVLCHLRPIYTSICWSRHNRLLSHCSLESTKYKQTNICLYICIYIYIYPSQTARHFRWPCAFFADTGVFKIRITILKSMQYVAFLWDFSQITSNHQSNTKKQYLKIWFFKYQIYQVPWNSMEFHRTSKKFHEFHGIPWNFLGKNKRGIPWNSGVWKKFHGIPWNFGSGQNSMEFHGTWGFVAQVPWNSMEPQVLFKCCSKSSMERWRKFHGAFWSK